MPKAKVYKCYDVEDSFKSYVESESIFNNFTDEEKAPIRKAVVEKGKEEALKAGLLDKAEKNAETLIESMVKTKREDNVEVVFEWE